MKKKIFFLFLFFLFFFDQAETAGLELKNICPTGECELRDLCIILGNLYGTLFYFAVLFGALFLTIGGILFFFSGGQSERVKIGKAVLTSAIVGLIIIFAAELIIFTILKTMGVKPSFINLVLSLFGIHLNVARQLMLDCYTNFPAVSPPPAPATSTLPTP
jgi:hypothetical protein